MRDQFPTTVGHDFFATFAGDLIAEGSCRSVYAMRREFGENMVIKIETAGGSFQNVREWMLWNDFKDIRGVGRYLAPCIRISPCGSVLIQARTTPVTRSQLPAKVPTWFSDAKLENVGMYEGRLVAHDYGTATLSMSIDLEDAEWK